MTVSGTAQIMNEVRLLPAHHRVAVTGPLGISDDAPEWLEIGCPPRTPSMERGTEGSEDSFPL